MWLEAADALDSPVAEARLYDLLWERRVQPRPDQHARSAVDAYLQLAELPHWHLVDRSRCLSRALELSRAVNDADRFDAVSARCRTFVEKILALEDRGPGPAMTILRALVDLPAERRPPDIGAMLLAAVKRFGDDPHLFDALAELRTRIAGTDAQVALRREQVAHWREASKDGDNFLRVIRLEQALEVARTHGLAEEADEIRRELQDVKPEDLDLQSIGIPPNGSSISVQ